jgi:hypothetical protein
MKCREAQPAQPSTFLSPLSEEEVDEEKQTAPRAVYMKKAQKYLRPKDSLKSGRFGGQALTHTSKM